DKEKQALLLHRLSRYCHAVSASTTVWVRSNACDARRRLYAICFTGMQVRQTDHAGGIPGFREQPDLANTFRSGGAEDRRQTAGSDRSMRQSDVRSNCESG